VTQTSQIKAFCCFFICWFGRFKNFCSSHVRLHFSFPGYLCVANHWPAVLSGQRFLSRSTK